jgi:hypothetical protein
MTTYNETLPGDFSLELKEELPDVVTAKAMLLGTTTVAEWEEGGHQFRVDKLVPPKDGYHYELFSAGVPGGGSFMWRYHETIELARQRAKIMAEKAMAVKILHLEHRLEVYKHQRRDDVLAMEIAIEYIENTPDLGGQSLMIETLRGRIEGKLSWPTP